MKYQLVLLSLLAAISFDQATGADNAIKVKETADGIELYCGDKTVVRGNGKNGTEVKLEYRDDESGEYSCESGSKIYVKFRTCDNCVELDAPSIVGLAVGDIVATVVVGVAVYLIASQARTGQVKPTKKRSDKQNLIHNEAPSDPSYQPLTYRRGKDEYDVLNKK